MDYDVVAVMAVEHLHLRVEFRDGLTGDVILLESHLDGVFRPLRDPRFFGQVGCPNGFVEWPGEIDLAPDAIYQAVKEFGVCELA
jgi:hypothetical protein